ncbi:hypothetical protein BDB01DRAFT_789023 [Pilobolus umbonatus]|nr:hypothetical protein BDB01DRAFT_789023 [Pilobolus umbonatus]
MLLMNRILWLFLIGWHLVEAAYKKGDLLPIYYNKIFSLSNQLTYSYHSLPFICPPQQSHRHKSWLIFDQDLRGDRLIESGYKIKALVDEECRILCKQSWSIETALKVEELIQQEYLVEWELEDIPGVTVSYTNERPDHTYRVGFPLGFMKADSIYINNHVTFQILYTQDTSGEIEVVGFEVYPDSVAEDECMKQNVDYKYQEVIERRSTITYTYSVKWKEVKGITNKWDPFLLAPDHDRHFYARLNGTIMALLTSLVITIVMLKTMQKDSSGLQEDKDIKTFDDVDEYIGWRLINRDVFRRPIYGGLLTPLMGTGIQLIIVYVGLIVCLYMGWYHPAQPGSLTRWFTLLFMLGSVPAGYWSARVYKVFRGKSWILNSVLTSLVVPSIVLLVIFGLSTITWSHNSSLAISFPGWVSMIALWLFMLVPLTFIGAYFGEKTDRMEVPSRTTQIPRVIPPQKWYQNIMVRALLSGVIPFSIAFLDWHELLNSVSRGEYTLSIEHTTIIAALMLITASEVTVILVFLQLCAEDFHWWWKSFVLGGSSACYLFLYGLYFLMKRSNVQGLTGSCIYIINLLLGCGLIGLCTGTLGFLFSYMMIRYIYSFVKVD